MEVWETYQEIELQPIIREYNSKYGVLLCAGKFRILVENKKASTYEESFSILTLLEFKALTDNDRVVVYDKNGEENTVRKCDIWLASRGRREFIDGLAFAPGEEQPIKGRFNIWKGWNCKPKPKECYLFKEHLLNMCNNNYEIYTWLMDWLADAIQDPQNPKRTGIVLNGEGREVKEAFTENFAALFGMYYKRITNQKDLTKENAEETLLIHLDDIKLTKGSITHPVITQITTNERAMIKRRTIPMVHIKNMARIIITCNKTPYIPQGGVLRRWLVLDVEDNPVNPELLEQMQSGGYEGLLKELKERKITSNLRITPVTIAPHKVRAQEMSENSVISWWVDCIKKGSIERTPLKRAQGWPTYQLKSDCFPLYKEWCIKNNIKHLSAHAMHKTLQDTLELKSYRKAAKPSHTQRVPHYVIPRKNDCKRTVKQKTGIHVY